MTEILASYGVSLSPEVLDEARLIGSLLESDLPHEMASAVGKHPPMRNGHEVYGVVREGLEEFFDLVRGDSSCLGMLEGELLHVAVTALRGAAMYRKMRLDQV